MGLQSKLNQEALDMVPRIKAAIENAGAFSAAQMLYKTMDEMMRAKTPIIEMTNEELDQFQNDLIDPFFFKGGISHS
jgi:hypothetical protein